MTTLTVALPLVRPTVGTEFGYVLQDDRQAVAGHGVAPLALLPGADTLVLVVPARALSWHELTLPPVAASRLRAALDGALEDRLLDEPANLAFAVGPQRAADGSVTVAVCDKPWLRAALEFFEQSGRPASRVVPEFAPTGAAEAQQVHVIGTADEAWAALVDTHGVVCVPLRAAAALLGDGALDGAGVTVLAAPALAELAEQVLARPVSIQQMAQGLLASSRSAWELAQFDLTTSSGGRMARRWAQRWRAFLHSSNWRPTRWGLAALVLVNLIGLNAFAWRQDVAVREKREQVKSLFSQTFPKVRTIVDAPLQMERELARLRQASGALSGRDLESMLGAFAPALPKGQNLSAIEFTPGEVVMRGLRLDAAQLAQVGTALAVHGYSARLDGERLVLRAGAAP